MPCGVSLTGVVAPDIMRCVHINLPRKRVDCFPSPAHAEQLFARRMRDFREKRGLSQAGLAQSLEQLGLKIDASAITRIEKNADGGAGARAIRLGEAVAISHALGEDIWAMLEQEPSTRQRLSDLRAARDWLLLGVAENQARIGHFQWMIADLEYQLQADQADQPLSSLNEQLSEARRQAERATETRDAAEQSLAAARERAEELERLLEDEGEHTDASPHREQATAAQNDPRRPRDLIDWLEGELDKAEGQADMRALERAVTAIVQTLENADDHETAQKLQNLFAQRISYEADPDSGLTPIEEKQEREGSAQDRRFSDRYRQYETQPDGERRA